MFGDRDGDVIGSPVSSSLEGALFISLSSLFDFSFCFAFLIKCVEVGVLSPPLIPECQSVDTPFQK